MDGSLFWVKVAAMLLVSALLRREVFGAETVGDETGCTGAGGITGWVLVCWCRRMRMIVQNGIKRSILG
jgi:hypothetical protein